MLRKVFEPDLSCPSCKHTGLRYQHRYRVETFTVRIYACVCGRAKLACRSVEVQLDEMVREGRVFGRGELELGEEEIVRQIDCDPVDEVKCCVCYDAALEGRALPEESVGEPEVNEDSSRHLVLCPNCGTEQQVELDERGNIDLS